MPSLLAHISKDMSNPLVTYLKVTELGVECVNFFIIKGMRKVPLKIEGRFLLLI